MAVGLVILVAIAAYRTSVRQYHKRKAKKFDYRELDHDALWRPLDGVNGRKLSRNEARALAQHRRERKATRASESDRFERGNVLPPYNAIDQQDRKDHRTWQQPEGSSDVSGSQEHVTDVNHDLTQDVTRISWSAAPSYPHTDVVRSI